MPALLRYFSDLIHFKTSNPNPIPLHGNPVLDNFVFKHAAVQTGRTFASAHSCGLRPRTMMIFCNLQIFASAHSCGLRPIPVQQTRQRVSLPQRIRAGCDEGSYGNGKSLSSLPQRISAGCDHGFSQHTASIVTLPQRIRAGCDKDFFRGCSELCLFATAHSRGLRPPPANRKNRIIHFATAHSRGLRLH